MDNGECVRAGTPRNTRCRSGPGPTPTDATRALIPAGGICYNGDSGTERGVKMPAVSTGKVAHPFELTSADGHPYSLEEGLSRGPVLAAFFKVACPTCQYTFPFLERLYQQFRPHPIQIWGISQDDAESSRRFAKEFRITFPVLIDDYPYETSRAFGLTHVPTLFLIAHGGRV